MLWVRTGNDRDLKSAIYDNFKALLKKVRGGVKWKYRRQSEQGQSIEGVRSRVVLLCSRGAF